MIAGFRDRWLEEFFANALRSRNVPADIADRLFRKLQMIDDAMTDRDLRVPPSNQFEKLSGRLKDFHSIRVNQKWRLIFRWDGSRDDASELYSDDHSCR